MEELSLREIQKCSLNILLEIDQICRKHDIEYFLYFGTLIGAVRHKGFIPWDDDIDIALKRKDYNKLLHYMSLESKFRVVNYETDVECPYTITRISDDNYIMVSPYGSDYRIGTFVDVYPIDGLGSDLKEAKKLMCRAKRYASGYHKSCEKNVIGMCFDLHRNIRKIYALMTYMIPKIRGREYYKKNMEKLVRTYDMETSQYIGYLGDTEMVILEKKDLEHSMDMQFEGHMLKIPQEYDKNLTKQYGDYMKLPKEKDRIAHHFYKIYKV
ncbi:MAG: LicD family protein [Lachnoclostridium sp.]|nr:LicD family protein [Lachnospira sp.]MCM1247216.1 LicD family protein [Lachnoclostridium sp.]MCM1534563.1 LicD family protein [Clostridium sp.]